MVSSNTRCRTKILTSLALGLLIFGFGLRYYFLDRVVTHYDDIGVFIPLMDAIAQHSSLKNSLNFLQQWTYAPAQFILTLQFLKLASTFEQVLFWGRFPSFLMSVIGLSCLFLLLRNLVFEISSQKSKEPFLFSILLPLTFAVFSLRGMTESSQGYNYASTTLVAVGITWAMVSARGAEILQGKRGWIQCALFGFALGWTNWFTYQAILILVSGYLSLGILALLKKDRTAIFGIGVAGIFTLLPFFGLYEYLLKFSIGRGLPNWATLPRSPGFFGSVSFLFNGWFLALQNNLAIVPWGIQTRILASLFLILLGVFLISLRKRDWKNSTFVRLNLFLGALFFVFSIGCLLEKFPLGPTRHTFVLQVPILLLLMGALERLRPKASAVAVSCLVLITAFWIQLPKFDRSVKNQIDYPRIRQLVTTSPNVALMDVPHSWTWDHEILSRELNQAGHSTRTILGEFNPISNLESDKSIQTLILISNRFGMNEDQKNTLRQAGFKEIQTLVEIAPTGSTELSGIINGGNGFYLYLAKR